MHTLILSLWRRNRMSIFMVTHDLKESFTPDTRVLVLDLPHTDPQSQKA